MVTTTSLVANIYGSSETTDGTVKYGFDEVIKGKLGWRPAVDDPRPFIVIKFVKPLPLTGFEIKLDNVNSFYIKFSNDGSNYVSYTEYATTRVSNISFLIIIRQPQNKLTMR